MSSKAFFALSIVNLSRLKFFSEMLFILLAHSSCSGRFRLMHFSHFADPVNSDFRRDKDPTLVFVPLKVLKHEALDW